MGLLVHIHILILFKISDFKNELDIGIVDSWDDIRLFLFSSIFGAECLHRNQKVL